MQKQTEVDYTIRPVERALVLLQYIADGNACVNLKKTAAILWMNRTTVMRLLYTLTKHNIIVKNEDGYRIGNKLMNLAGKSNASQDIVSSSQPHLKDLADTLNLSSHLAVLVDTHIVYLGREVPNTSFISNIFVGMQHPAHGTTIGRAILSAMPPQDIRILYQGKHMEAFTNKTPTNIDSLIAQVQQDAKSGYAWSENNFELGIGSCGAVIYNAQQKPVAGINVSGPVAYFERDKDKIIQAVTQTAQSISQSL